LRGWLTIGQPFDLFWTLTPADIVLIMEIKIKGMEGQAAQRRGEIYALASLVRIAFHDPNKFPTHHAFAGTAGTKTARFSNDREISLYFQTIKNMRAAPK
jgi:hypothetical protein